ncbi:urease accessory protein UreD [Paucibacter sp. Y2R2-4]|uniref:urease accessory protein UreD n=1 Tax=Paucibacter sp. Y2R2-4 TaxID=2893553 RepID=UPI0021E3C6B9|nr:urease accessory protein UreD [Paucibacter sp. Y2R2-4]MCV2351194.1 urease accessory protein UreD [Paucibacter sp. Y2R2-4]
MHPDLLRSPERLPLSAGSNWRASLALDYTLEAQRSVLRYRHDGPLRILKSLYPEGDAVCHNVLVHPPGGLVGGDTLDVQLRLAEGAHGLITTPGATRFYRSEAGALATQKLHAQLAGGSRLEWLPLEALAYPACDALNEARFELAPGAEMMAWDITALGLPVAGAPFDRGRFAQHLEVCGVWLERGLIEAQDELLMNGALGLAGRRCMATLVFAAGHAITRPRQERALEAVRALIEAQEREAAPEAGLIAGATAAHGQVLVLRALSHLTEPSLQLLRQAWALWRHELWGLSATPPRIWSM